MTIKLEIGPPTTNEERIAMELDAMKRLHGPPPADLPPDIAAYVEETNASANAKRRQRLEEVRQDATQAMHAGLAVVLYEKAIQLLDAAGKAIGTSAEKSTLSANPQRAELLSLTMEINDFFAAFRPELASDEHTKEVLRGNEKALCFQCERDVSHTVRFWSYRAVAHCTDCGLTLELPLEMPGPTALEDGMLWADARLAAFIKRQYPGNEALQSFATELEDESKAVAAEASDGEHSDGHLWSLWFDVDEEGEERRLILDGLAVALWEGVVQPQYSAKMAAPHGVWTKDKRAIVKSSKVLSAISWGFGGGFTIGEFAEMPGFAAQYVPRGYVHAEATQGRPSSRQLPLAFDEVEPVALAMQANALITPIAARLLVAVLVTADPSGAIVQSTIGDLADRLWPDDPRPRHYEAIGNGLRALSRLHLVAPDNTAMRAFDVRFPVSDATRSQQVSWGLGGAFLNVIGSMTPWNGSFLINLDDLLAMDVRSSVPLRCYIHAASVWNDTRSIGYRCEYGRGEWAKNTNSYSPKADAGDKKARQRDQDKVVTALKRLHDEGLVIYSESPRRKNKHYSVSPPKELIEAYDEIRARGARRLE